MADVITTLHPEGAPEDNLYPNIKEENLPQTVRDYLQHLKDGEWAILWLNSSPNSSLSIADITIPDVSEYESFLFGVKQESTYNRMEQYFLATNKGERYWVYFSFNDGGNVYARGAWINGTTFHVEHGWIAGSIRDDACLPVVIYGRKRSIS